ncbi:MAG: hypothetical protein LBI77_01105 [Puniceicoccales bacterium]|jgi:hypothetical protein|nr:hypothetical protein [Puniceicoccales bacterium]
MDTALAIPISQLGKGRRQANSAPIRRKKRWSLAEDKALVTLVMQYGTKNWKLISEQMIGCTPRQCKNRWFDSLDLSKKSRHWTREEEQQLIALVQQNGTESWPDKAVQIPGRTTIQCREHWKNCLDSSKNRGPWTQEEDQRLVEQFQKMGSKWAQIAKFFPGRTDIDLRNRWVKLYSAKNPNQGSDCPASAEHNFPDQGPPSRNSTTPNFAVNFWSNFDESKSDWEILVKNGNL